MNKRKQRHVSLNAEIPTPDLNCQPIDPNTGQALPPRAQVGYYPGYQTLSQQRFWDAATRDVVLRRVHDVPPIRFFTPAEARQLAAVAARIIPQDDRDLAYRIPIVPWIDERLYSGRIDGYRYEGMPPDGEAHRLGLQAINDIARALHDKDFIDLTPPPQEDILRTLHDGNPPAGHAIWARMPVQRYWMLLVQDCIEVYFAHPFAWDEIGYGGPAYPRGYMRLQHGQPEPWEKDEVRYPWRAPTWSVSQEYTPLGGGHETIPPGQEGTH